MPDKSTAEATVTHTPGPWRFEWRHPDLAVWGGPGAPDNDTHVASIYGDGSVENAEANARLIAMAPELYEFVRSIATNEPSNARAHTAQRWAESLLAKAEGRIA